MSMKYYIKLFLGIPVRLLVALFPRNKNLIVYGGSRDLLIDNAKHQFIINNETMPSYRHVWLTKNKEIYNYMIQHHFNVVMSNSWEGILMIMTAGFVVFDDSIDHFSYSILSEGSQRINLWHGIPAKMIGTSNKDEDYVICTSKGLLYRFLCSHIKGDYCVCPSKNLSRYYSFSFKIPLNNLLICGYPRTHVLFMSEDEHNRYINKYESEDFSRLFTEIKHNTNRKIIYMPTFRDNDPDYISKAIPDWHLLNKACEAAGITFFVKVHRVTPVPKEDSFSNIVILENEMDIYPLLPLFDLLITDYSSIMFDYSLLKKKILLYTFDIQQYRTQSRPLYNFFDELLCEISHVDSFDDLLFSMSGEFDSFKPFPYERFFDAPHNYLEVKTLIEKLS